MRDDIGDSLGQVCGVAGTEGAMMGYADITEQEVHGRERVAITVLVWLFLPLLVVVCLVVVVVNWVVDGISRKIMV